MFREPKPHLIESDTGFSVERIEFSQLLYREDDRSVTLSIEPLVGDSAIFVLYLAERDCWDAPFDKVKITEEEWKRIGENIRDAYRSQGHEIEIMVPPPHLRKLFRPSPHP